MNILYLLDIDCDWSTTSLQQALLKLPENVRARADRYRCPNARRNLIVTQFCLQEVFKSLELQYVGIELCPNGRPSLPNSTWEFNLSHSHSRAVLALANSSVLKLALGVDIEWMDRRLERDALAKRFFTAQECAFVRGNKENFFHVWTRKEAVLKSNGIGLRVELDSFDVLRDEVAQEVSGRPLVLNSTIRHSSYMVSWALAGEWEKVLIRWIHAFKGEWIKLIVEGIEA